MDEEDLEEWEDDHDEDIVGSCCKCGCDVGEREASRRAGRLYCDVCAVLHSEKRGRRR